MPTRNEISAPPMTALDTERLRREVSRQGLRLADVFSDAGMHPALARTPYGALLPIECAECERLAEVLGIEPRDISISGLFGQ